MDLDLFEKIVDELAETKPRRISLYLMNEPLLDNRLPDFVRCVAERVPDTSTLVTTNGVLLDESLTESLIDAGLKRIKVSIQSLNPETNMALMGSACDSRRVVENVLTAQRVIKRKRARNMDLRVSTIVTARNQEEVHEARRFWSRHGIRLVTSALENRGGNIADAGLLNPHNMTPMDCNCIRPSREMCVLFNGDVVLCCVDWFRTCIVGNLEEQSVREVWNGLKLKAIRAALKRDEHAAQPTICQNCAESAKPDYHRRGLKGWATRRFGLEKKHECICGGENGAQNAR